MRGSKFPADMHNYIWCPIYIASFMIIGSVVSEELRWQDFGTDGRSDCTPRPAFAFGDAGKKLVGSFIIWMSTQQSIHSSLLTCYTRNQRAVHNLLIFHFKQYVNTILDLQILFVIFEKSQRLLMDRVREKWKLLHLILCN